MTDRRFSIGGIQIELINDADSMTDSGGVFGLVPRVLWSQYMQPDDQGRVPMCYNCLLVKAGGKNIIVETGMGRKMNDREKAFVQLERPAGDLVEGLAARGLAPEDIDLVIDTHLHSDHCSGNTYFDEDGQVVPTFPNAEYWVQRLEYADAAFPNERTRGTYFPHNFATLYESGQMILLDGETEVVPGMRLVVTPGHTRAHQSVIFEQGDQAAIFVADMATMAIHFERLAWMTAYDIEPLVTLETKRDWQAWAVKKNALIIFYHDPITPLARLVQTGKRPELVAVDPAEL